MKIQWINTNPDAQADEHGFWRSIEGRFTISPNYRSTIYPDSYTLRDGMTSKSITRNRVRDCKDKALSICLQETEAEMC